MFVTNPAADGELVGRSAFARKANWGLSKMGYNKWMVER
jgi:hypothetical protein